MRQSDSLFRLIKSLTKSEKRYFKLSLAGFQGEDEKLYLRLFDAMEAQKVYDEKAIKLKFRGIPYFRHFSRIKNYLYRQLLKKLRNFYDESSIEIKLNNYASEIEILFKKELFAECKTLIQKARAVAAKREKFTWLQQLIEWDINLPLHTGNVKQLKLLKRKAFAEKENVLDKCAEFNDLMQLELEAYLLRVQGVDAFSSASKSGFNAILTQPVMKKKLQSFHAEFTRLDIHINHAYFLKDFEATRHYASEMIHLMESSPIGLEDIKEDVNVYFHIYIVLLDLCMVTNRLSEASQHLDKLKKINAKFGDRIKAQERILLLTLEMNLLKRKGEFEQAALLPPGINELLEKHYKKTGQETKLLFFLNFSNTYLLHKDFKNTQFFLQKILNYPDQDIRPDLQRVARIFNLLVQFEQREYVHLRYLLRNTYRFLLKSGAKSKVENFILRFLKQAPSFKTQKKNLNALAELKEQILPIAAQPLERDFLLQFPFIEWIDSKLQNRDLAEIMKQKYSAAVAKEKKMAATGKRRRNNVA